MSAPRSDTDAESPPRPWGRGLDLATWAIVALVALRVLALAAALASHPDADGSTIGGDARRYDQIAAAEGAPYRDVAIEYPPGSVVVIEAVHGETLFDTQLRLGVSQLACDLAAAAALGWAFGRRTAVAYLLLGLPFLALPFLYLRIDLVSVALAAMGVAVVHRRRDLAGDVLGGSLLALGAVAKLWPFVLLPLLAVERRWRALVSALVVGAACGLAWVAVAGVDGVVQVLSFRGAQGWQVESLTGIVVHVLEPARIHVEGGAWRTGTMPAGARTVLTALSLATAAVVWWWAERRRRLGGPDGPHAVLVRYGLAPAAAVLGLLVWAPIISPQYVLWVLPFAAVAAAHGDRSIGWLTFAAAALSTYSLATIRAQIDGELWATLPIAARNVVLVITLCHLLVALSGHGRTAPVLPAAPVRPAAPVAPDDAEVVV